MPYNDSSEKINENNGEGHLAKQPNIAAPAVSWRDALKVHEAAELFPRMTPDELKVLGEDIIANGLRSPITITASKGAETGWTYKLVDGRNRLDAMEAVGFPARLELLKGQCSVILHADLDHDFSDANVIEGDPVAYIISANLHRRHLTAEQKRDLIAKLLKMQPERSNNTTAKLAKVDDKTVASVRRELESTSEIPKLKKTIGADGKARKQPAKRKVCFEKREPAPSEALEVKRPTVPDDIGSTGRSEQRLQAQIEELQLEIRRRDFEIIDLRGQNGSLQEAISAAEARFSGYLSTTQLVDLLESRLERDGINATATLQKIRKLIDRPPTINLKALPAAGAA